MRRGELIINLLVFGGPLFLMGLLFWGSLIVSIIATAPSRFVFTTLILYIIGFSLFLRAKLSVISKGKSFTFGCGEMNRINRSLYITGYAIMGAGTIIILVLALLSKHGF